ncbi:glutathione S-transferase N-terminal domain-containing protein [Paludibacterium purpuratum]|uniref:Glutathione S-transferase n=1 Tax=Paludibacterium purpuratum TaxID=1144873 RepID=A0A4R7B8K0_9NEIS|nr:glutathione S-transferase N-terminal domain-containing protein [Paludibacterium purpuratum]TDR80212.1 glutathione S-transferase [Paludibacterium purpuratum]
MQLIGMLDSPFVRRVAISLHQLQCTFEHRAISVFRDMDLFRQINPVIKVPTWVCDDGTVLMDSTLILDAVEAQTGKSLMPHELSARRHALRVIGLALIAAEKSVQIYYEQNLRPSDKQHEPWLERIVEQAAAAFALLEIELAAQPLDAGALDQAGITAAVAWRFARERLPQCFEWQRFPALSQWSETAEALPAFRAAPFYG